MLDAGYWILDVGGSGCWVLDAGCVLMHALSVITTEGGKLSSSCCCSRSSCSKFANGLA